MRTSKAKQWRPSKETSSAGHRVLRDATWRMQYDRMLRSRGKLKPYDSNEEYEDVVIHFFQDAWHLKDWLKGDPAVPGAVKNRVEEWEKKCPLALAAASDIANGTKHMVMDQQPRVGMAKVRQDVTIRIGQDPPIETRIWFQAKEGELKEAAELADAVIQEWRGLLQGTGLLAP